MVTLDRQGTKYGNFIYLNLLHINKEKLEKNKGKEGL